MLKKHRDIKLVTREGRRNYLVSEPNYNTTKFFTEDLLAIEMKKTEILMNKPAHLGLSVLELSKILMYEFLYDYVKPKWVLLNAPTTDPPTTNHLLTDQPTDHQPTNPST